MLLQYFSLIDDAPVAVLILIAATLTAMLLGLSVHEFSHALVADRLGDSTPRRYGRLTLDPRAHLDPFGSLMILFAGFGWAKPTPVNPNNTQNPRMGMVLIALGGPVSNLLIAAIAGIPLRFDLVSMSGTGGIDSAVFLIALFFSMVVSLNVSLAVFNLLPIAPLDGFRVLVGLLPPDFGRQVERLEPWGMGILMVLFFLPFMTGFSPLLSVMGPPIRFFVRLFTGESWLLFG